MRTNLGSQPEKAKKHGTGLHSQVDPGRSAFAPTANITGSPLVAN
jgi:hypothetical protein